jgi:hypothetical protein
MLRKGLAGIAALALAFGFTPVGRVAATGQDYPPSWQDSDLAHFYYDTAYNDGVSAGGSPRPWYLIGGGDLPTGIELNETTGAVTGTPTVQDEEYDFTLQATNGEGNDTSAEFSGTVGDPPRGCQSYTADSYVGAVVLNPDGTPIGCGMTDSTGSPADLVPSTWPSEFTAAFGPGVARNSYGYTTRLGWACDDCWVASDGVDGNVGLPIGFDMNFYGTTYSTVFVESNGSISFGKGSDEYDEPLDVVLDGAAGVVPFGIDLWNGDIAYAGSPWGSARHEDFFYWGRTTYGGQPAFVATWMNIKGCCDGPSTTDYSTFQVMLVHVPGGGGNDVNIIINYGSMTTTGQGYSNGDSTARVAAGVGTVENGVTKYASLVDDSGTLYNGMPTDDVLDGGAHPLSSGHLNSTVPGRFIFQMRNGQLPQTATIPGAPAITSIDRGDSSGNVNFTAPTDTGGSPISGYVVQWRKAGSSDNWDSDDSATSSPFDIHGLDNGYSYEVEVSAVNGMGQGPWSAPADVTPGAEGSPEWTDTTLGSMMVGTAYSDGVAASGDPTPTYSVTDGDLPAGLTLDPDTGAITGTPTTAGPYDFTVTASSSGGVGDPLTCVHEFTGTVLAEQGMSLNHDSQGAGGTVHVDSWGFKPGASVVLTLHSDPVTLGTFTANDGGHVIADVVIPANTPLGAHTVQADGNDPDDSPITESHGITVTAQAASAPPTATASSSAQRDSGIPIGALVLIGAFLAGALIAFRRRAEILRD